MKSKALLYNGLSISELPFQATFIDRVDAGCHRVEIALHIGVPCQLVHQKGHSVGAGVNASEQKISNQGCHIFKVQAFRVAVDVEQGVLVDVAVSRILESD